MNKKELSLSEIKCFNLKDNDIKILEKISKDRFISSCKTFSPIYLKTLVEQDKDNMSAYQVYVDYIVKTLNNGIDDNNMIKLIIPFINSFLKFTNRTCICDIVSTSFQDNFQILINDKIVFDQINGHTYNTSLLDIIISNILE